MAIKGYHLISLEGKDIYEQEMINGVEKGFILPSKKDRKFWGLFKNVFDYSLDLIELEKCYYSICRNKFSFEDEYAVLLMRLGDIYWNMHSVFVY